MKEKLKKQNPFETAAKLKKAQEKQRDILLKRNIFETIFQPDFKSDVIPIAGLKTEQPPVVVKEIEEGITVTTIKKKKSKEKQDD